MANNVQKRDISNNVLVVLIAVTIFISIVGTWISISKLSPLTGFAATTTTLYGQVNVSINCTAGIGFARGNVNFTSAMPGDARTTLTAADLDNSGPFNITNDGTGLINVSIAAANIWSSTQGGVPSKFFSYNVTHINAGAGIYKGNCSLSYPTGLFCAQSGAGPNATCGLWRMFQSSADSGAICRLNFTDGSDSVLVHVNITVPNDEPSGKKNATITFTASADTCA
ncbi:MAG: hypothetical protein AABW41_04740 [Nanoarchaeota archaeon]